MFILVTQLIFATHMGGFSEPPIEKGRFATLAACQQEGKRLFLARRNDDMVESFTCDPE